jgi:hypothetical protein
MSQGDVSLGEVMATKLDAVNASLLQVMILLGQILVELEKQGKKK